MKILPLFCFLFLAPLLQAQEIITHKLFPPDSKDNSDLKILERELEGKQLVMLGEMTHMYGNIFEMKARIVEYLHQELGFTTIAMETSMYDLWLMNSEHSNFEPSEFNNAVFGVWSQTEEFQRMVQYIEKNNLKVMGFDSQINNNISDFVDGFFEFCQKHGIKISLDKDDMGIAMEEVLDEVVYMEDDIKFKSFEKEVRRIIGSIEKLPASDENFHWLQFSKSLLASSRSAFYEEEVAYKSDRADKNSNHRDAQMADNLLSYMRRHPEEKIIAWADNIHIINDISSIKDPVLQDFISMGTPVKKALGDKAYSLATVHANDSLLEMKTWHHTPVLESSFEGELASLHEPILFVSSSQDAMRKPRQQRLLNFINFSEARLDQLHDGYIFIREATLPKHKEIKQTEEQAPNKDVAPSQPVTAKFETRRLETTLLDAVSKAPVPYATVILLNGEVYRISDEEGNFELPAGNLPADGVLQISSIGYEIKEVSLSELGQNILLHPQLEQLQEVILTGHKSSPKKILKKAIQNIEENYFMNPYNFSRYGHFILNRDDEKLQDLEIITTDYSGGARETHPVYQKVEQVKWNKVQPEKNYENALRLPGFREDPIKFASVLHKRKYKKFNLEFVQSGKPEDQELYIIRYSTNKTRFGYTNRWFPTSYSGIVYINKKDRAIVKVVQNWDVQIPEEDVEKVKYWLGEFKDVYRGKSETSSLYEKHQDGKYYPSEYFIRSYSEKTNMEGDFVNHTFEGHSYLSNFTDEDLHVITWENRLDNSLLNRVEYDETFWNSFERGKVN